MTDSPLVLVLILTFNGKDLLEECLSSYSENDYANFEIVLIDNGSSDGTEEYVKKAYPGVRILRSETNLFYSGGFNLGLNYAFDSQQADYALITNNDVKADRHLISALVEAAEEDKSRGFIIGKVYYYDQTDTFQTVGKKADPIMWNGGHIGKGEKDTGQFDTPSEREWCDDIYWLVSRRLYTVTGGYDTEFAFQAEDFDWEVRAKKAGFSIYYTPQAKLWHKESVTLGKTSPAKAYYDARNPLIVHLKYRSPEEFRIFFWIRIKALASGCLNLLIHLRLQHAFAMLKGLGSALVWGLKHKRLTMRHFIEL